MGGNNLVFIKYRCCGGGYSMNILQKVLFTLSLSLSAVPMQAMNNTANASDRVLGNSDLVRVIIGYNGLLNSTPYMTTDADGQINGHTFISLQGLKSRENQYCAALRKVAHEIVIGEQGINEGEFAQLVEALCDPRPTVQNACCDMVSVLGERMREAYVAQYQAMVLAERWEVRYDTCGGMGAGLLAQLRHHNDNIKKGTHAPNNLVVQTSVVLALDVMFGRSNLTTLSRELIAKNRLAAVLLADLVLNEYRPAQEIAVVKMYGYLQDLFDYLEYARNVCTLVQQNNGFGNNIFDELPLYCNFSLLGGSAFELLWALLDRECTDNALALEMVCKYRDANFVTEGLLRTACALVEKGYEPAYDVSCALLHNITLNSGTEELVFDELEALMVNSVDLDVIQAIIAKIKNDHAQYYMHRSEGIPLGQAYLGTCSVCSRITAFQAQCEQALHEQVLNEYDVYNECTVS